MKKVLIILLVMNNLSCFSQGGIGTTWINLRDSNYVANEQKVGLFGGYCSIDIIKSTDTLPVFYFLNETIDTKARIAFWLNFDTSLLHSDTLIPEKIRTIGYIWWNSINSERRGHHYFTDEERVPEENKKGIVYFTDKEIKKAFTQQVWDVVKTYTFISHISNECKIEKEYPFLFHIYAILK